MGLAFVERTGSGKLVPEWEALAAELPRYGYDVQRFRAKELTRRRLSLLPDTPVAGQITSVQEALRQLGIAPPAPLDYPESLRPYLKRRIWISTIEEITQRAWDDGPAVFVKPASRQKRFTGFVLDGPDTLWQFESTGQKQQVWCSAPVRFLSEWRGFVTNGTLIGLHIYTGDEDRCPDAAQVTEMIAVYSQHGAPAGYSIDIGILDTYETALIEVNDGFGLGKYGLSNALYTDLILARWQELTNSIGTVQ